MKKLFLGAFLTFCIGAIAQEYKYEPVSNKAEYYISKFKGFSSYADYKQWGMDAIEITNQQKNSKIWKSYYSLPCITQICPDMM